MKKNGISIRLMRRILKLFYPRSSIPKVIHIRQYFNVMMRKKQRKTRKPPANKLPTIICDFIIKSCIETEGLESTPELAKRIQNEFHRTVSNRTIRRYRNSFGYRFRRLRKAPYLTDLHKLNRLNWCLNNENTDFSNYVFVDETSVRLWDLPLYHWRLRNKYPRAIPMTEKYRGKLHVWGGMSFKGLTRFAVSIIFILSLIFLTNLATFLFKVF